MFDYYTIDTQSGKNIVVIANAGTFVIQHRSDSNLYWVPIIKNYNEIKIKCSITRDNYYLFNTFNTLYEELMEYQLLSNQAKTEESNVVNWYSDEDIEKPSSLQMYKENDAIKIVFDKGQKENYAVIIKSHDSKYAPANEAFMEMYNVLAYQKPQVKMEKVLKK